jgi:hypothetical protein
MIVFRHGVFVCMHAQYVCVYVTYVMNMYICTSRICVRVCVLRHTAFYM